MVQVHVPRKFDCRQFQVQGQRRQGTGEANGSRSPFEAGGRQRRVEANRKAGNVWSCGEGVPFGKETALGKEDKRNSRQLNEASFG